LDRISDHCSSAPRIICTRETAALHAQRKRAREAVTLDFHVPHECGDATIELLPAGHTLGSAVESGASKIYTVHGAPGFAAHLRSIGLDAEHLAAHPNKPDEVRSRPLAVASLSDQYALELA